MRTAAIISLALALVLPAMAAVALLIPATASADQMTFDFATAVGIDYWARRNVATPCRPQQRVYTADEIAGQEAELRAAVVDMLADTAACTIDVLPWAALDESNDSVDRANYCFEIAHEIGHLAGLEHPDHTGLTPEQRAFVTGTVMDEWGDYPFGCVHPRQWKVLQGWRKPPRWVRHSSSQVQALWLAGHVWRARSARRVSLRSR